MNRGRSDDKGKLWKGYGGGRLRRSEGTINAARKLLKSTNGRRHTRDKYIDRKTTQRGN